MCLFVDSHRRSANQRLIAALVDNIEQQATKDDDTTVEQSLLHALNNCDAPIDGRDPFAAARARLDEIDVDELVAKWSRN